MKETRGWTTFAISLQLWPASRICLSRCSSWGVHGVLVRPRFLLESSVSKAGMETLGVVGSAVPGGSVFSFGLCEARRLRWLGGDDGGGRRSALGLGASRV